MLRYVLAAAGVFLVFVLLDVPCPVRLLLGVPCPACGVTRALLCLLRGNLPGYFALQPMALPLLAAVVLCLVLPVIRNRGLRIGVYVLEGLVLGANTALYVLRLVSLF